MPVITYGGLIYIGLLAFVYDLLSRGDNAGIIGALTLAKVALDEKQAENKVVLRRVLQGLGTVSESVSSFDTLEYPIWRAVYDTIPPGHHTPYMADCLTVMMVGCFQVAVGMLAYLLASKKRRS